MATKEYAGTDLAEIRAALTDEGFTELHADNGASGFDLWRPFDDLPQEHCVHVIVWPCMEHGREGGYWAEEY